MKALTKRIARLEQAEPTGQRPALVVLHGTGFDPEAMTGVDGVNLPRRAGESVADYLARLEAHLRAERGRALPVCFARYGAADEPDGPPEQDAAEMLKPTVEPHGAVAP